MRPNPLITRAYLARGAQLWIGARLLVSVPLALAGMDPFRLTFATAMLIVGGTVLLGVADVYRRHERALLENLAVSRPVVFVFLAAPAILGELLISAAAGLRG
jgi:hypothetical protein